MTIDAVSLVFAIPPFGCKSYWFLKYRLRFTINMPIRETSTDTTVTQAVNIAIKIYLSLSSSKSSNLKIKTDEI